ncbi:MAG: T9SS type A sorting domain-containing protein [Bacteroidales bacterium]|nr:T9SS type A sorting domain-containing protein [Bacteroidales bacterium]
MKNPFFTSVLFTACIFIIQNAFAQAPGKLSYQAVIRNSSGQLVTNQAVGMQIVIFQGSIDGNVVYEEVQTPVTNANGLVSTEIGGNAGFDAIDWAGGPFFLRTDIDIGGGTNYTITSTSQMLSVPYALHAKTAEAFTGTLTETQDLSDVAAIDNSVNTQLKDVTDPTDAQDAATKAYVDALVSEIQVLTTRVQDAEGNLYSTVKIGNQVWMGENLRTTLYRNHEAIPLVTGNTAWTNLTTPAYCWYDNDDANKIYGALYNWYTVNTGNLCPAGWHVPTDEEMTTLINYLGAPYIAGGKLKEAGIAHWCTPNAGSTNESGFTLSAYPNPVSDVLVLRIENDNCENLFYRLSDINGRQIENSEITDRKTCINMGGLMPAVYYLSVIKTGSLEGIVVFKIIKN